MTWTSLSYFANAVETGVGGAAWNAETNAAGATEPNDSDYAYTNGLSADQATNVLAFYNPDCASEIPGDESTTVIDNISLTIRVALSANQPIGGVTIFCGFSDGPSFDTGSFATGTTLVTITESKSCTSWGLTQAEAWDFLLNGSSLNSFEVEGEGAALIGSPALRCHYALCKVDYTYTPPGAGAILLGKL